MKHACWILLITLLCTAPVAHAGKPLEDPIGTWELTLGGADKGLCFVSLNSDGTFSGYGISLHSDGLFTLAGQWSRDDNGIISGTYERKTAFTSALGLLAGTLRNGKVTFKGLEGNALLMLKGGRASTCPAPAGTYGLNIKAGKITLTEQCDFGAVSDYPNAYTMNSSGVAPCGPYDRTGSIIMDAKGTTLCYTIMHLASGELRTAILSGKYNPKKQTASLRGKDSTGTTVSVLANKQ